MSETAVNGVEPIIFLDDVHVTFRTRTGSILHPNLVHAVQGVTIKLMPGQTIGIVGESGCGKSTTANVMCGLQAPTSGKVYFKGKDVTKRTAEDRRHMGRVISVVFQNPAKPHQDSLEDGVAYAALMAEEMLSAQPAPFTAESIGAITAHNKTIPIKNRNCGSCIRYVKNRCVVSNECGKYTLWSPR